MLEKVSLQCRSSCQTCLQRSTSVHLPKADNKLPRKQATQGAPEGRPGPGCVWGPSVGTCLEGGHPGVPQGSSPGDGPFGAPSRPRPGLPLRVGGSPVSRSLRSRDWPPAPQPPQPPPGSSHLPRRVSPTHSGEGGSWSPGKRIHGAVSGRGCCRAGTKERLGCGRRPLAGTTSPARLRGLPPLQGAPWPVSEVLVLPVHPRGGTCSQASTRFAGLL